MEDPKIKEIVDKIVIIHQGKTFGYFDHNDVAQEIRLMCYRKIDGYKIDRSTGGEYYKGLEHWLNRIIANGLRNLYRDNMGGAIKHYKTDGPFDAEKRAAIAAAASLEDNYYYNATTNTSQKSFNEPTAAETVKAVAAALDEEARVVMDALASGCETITKHYRDKLIAACQALEKDHG